MKNRSKWLMCRWCRVEFEIVTEPRRQDHEASGDEEDFLDHVVYCPACGREDVESV